MKSHKINNSPLIQPNIPEKKKTGKFRSILKVNYLTPQESGKSAKAKQVFLVATLIAATGAAVLAAAAITFAAVAVLVPTLALSAVTIGLASLGGLGALALISGLAIGILGIAIRFQKVERQTNPSYTVNWDHDMHRVFANKSAAAKNAHLNKIVSEANEKEIEIDKLDILPKKRSKKTREVHFCEEIQVQGTARTFELNNAEDSQKEGDVLRRQEKDIEFREAVTDELRGNYSHGKLALVRFEELASVQVVTKNQFFQTFENTLNELYPHAVPLETKKHEIKFMSDVFYDILLKSSAEETLETIKNKFFIALGNKNGHSESIDRDTYEAMTHLFDNQQPKFEFDDHNQIVGFNQNKGIADYCVGKTAIFNKDFGLVDCSPEEYQNNLDNDLAIKNYRKLKEDFKNNLWKDSETRVVAYNVISRADFNSRLNALEEVFNEQAFQLTFQRLIR
jgi:hypothetical protein